MAQFGAGPEFAAQCPRVPAPEGWRPWTDADGPVPDALLTRSNTLVEDAAIPLGVTESYPLPGVTTLIRVEPHQWSRDETGNVIQGCFRAARIYLPGPPASAPDTSISPTAKLIGALTVMSLAVGIVGTVVSIRRKKKSS